MATIFTKILNGEVPASFVYRDGRVSAFMDVQPMAPGHVLVVPNQEVASLRQLDEDTSTHLFRIGHRLARALPESGLPCQGVTLWLADGEVAGQDVPHLHLHVFPRNPGDGIGWQVSRDYFSLPGREELERAAAAIRSALENFSG